METQRAWTGVRALELRWHECVWSYEERIAHLDRAEGSEGERQNVWSRPFVCDENEGHEKCNERFANYRQMMAHKTRKHGARTVLELWTRTNECPRTTQLKQKENATYILFLGTCYRAGSALLVREVRDVQAIQLPPVMLPFFIW